jgi:hypothetical protein
MRIRVDTQWQEASPRIGGARILDTGRRSLQSAVKIWSAPVQVALLPTTGISSSLELLDDDERNLEDHRIKINIWSALG